MHNFSFPKYIFLCLFIFNASDGLNHDHRSKAYLAKPATPAHSESHEKDFKGYASKKDQVSYEFSYNVRDDDSGLSFGHKESREGKKTEGEYRVKLPDGRTQIVTYVADEGGYRAKVSYVSTVEKYTADKNKGHPYRNEEKAPKELIYAKNKTLNERLAESLEDQRLRENLNKLAKVVDHEINNAAEPLQYQKHMPNGALSPAVATKMFSEHQISKPLQLLSKNPYFAPVVTRPFFDRKEGDSLIRDDNSNSVNQLPFPTFLLGISDDGPQEISSYLSYELNKAEETR